MLLVFLCYSHVLGGKFLPSPYGHAADILRAFYAVTRMLAVTDEWAWCLINSCEQHATNFDIGQRCVSKYFVASFYWDLDSSICISQLRSATYIPTSSSLVPRRFHVIALGPLLQGCSWPFPSPNTMRHYSSSCECSM